MNAPQHIVQFYDSDGYLLDEVVRFLAPAFLAGEAVFVLASEAHRRALEERLRAAECDLDAARAAGGYRALDTATTLAQVADDRANPAGLAAILGDEADPSPGKVAILWTESRPAFAPRLEALWSEVARRRPLSLLCAYPIRGFRREEDTSAFLEICAAHEHVVPAESYTRLPSIDERFRTVSYLQQKAQAMDSEVAERRHVEHELECRVAELAENNRRKDEFLAMLGHELRNPLSAVRNAIAAASLDETRRTQALEIARRQADRLGRLIDDLLDVARVTGGRIRIRKQRTTVEEMLDCALETMHPLIEDRGHHVTIRRGGGVRVDADPARFEQVLTNVVGNAAKFTPPGGTIDVSVEREADDAIIRVTDSGVGIEPAVLPRIFELFGQADAALDRPQGGLGVGLTLARRIVELHGGRIDVRSEGAGKGTEVVIRIPAVPESAEATGLRGESRRSRGARVLVVEDDPDTGESLRMLLAAIGYHARVALDAATALRTARANPPDVMLVDIGLPGIDGYEVARRVRGDRVLRDVMLIALTAYGRDEDRRRAVAAGFDDHLVKPVELGALETLVENTRRREPARAGGAL